MIPYFFGYGSLVNAHTHEYPDVRPAKLNGWRRAWVRTAAREVVFLTAVHDPNSSIQGVIAAVPNQNWDALDVREYGYARHPSNGAVTHDLSPSPEIAHYAIPPEAIEATGNHVILLSYLDVVVQGFLHLYQEPGVQAFFDTTSGWDVPVVNDRAAPVYPRHQTLSSAETDLVDHHLARLSAPMK